jgi:uncharacterized membrane protein YhfC
MSETDQPITQKQNSLIWEVLQVLRKLTKWMTTARDAERLCAALFEALAVFLLLDTWTKSKVRERNDDIFVLEHFLPAYQILKLK